MRFRICCRYADNSGTKPHSSRTRGVLGKVSLWRHHFFIRYEIIQYLIYLNEISRFVKICKKAVAPYGKLFEYCILQICKTFGKMDSSTLDPLGRYSFNGKFYLTLSAIPFSKFRKKEQRPNNLVYKLSTLHHRPIQWV